MGNEVEQIEVQPVNEPVAEVSVPETKKQQKLSPLILGLIIVAVLAVSAGSIFAYSRRNTSKAPEATASPQVATPAPTATVSSGSGSVNGSGGGQRSATTGEIIWMATSDGYQPSGTPPSCPAQMVSQFPADLTQVTSVLYPGQYRGGNYKSHGGLRFDNTKNNAVTVVAPFDGTVIDGAAYIADGTENDVQYTFDVINSCGMMFRLGHLLTLSPALADIAKNFPAPVKNDSRTTQVNPGVKVTAGTVFATAVGTASDSNTFFDWGVYDWNQANAVSSNSTWLSQPQHDNTLAKHGVCWFDQLSSTQAASIRSLPAADPGSGKTSDYCN